ncbi:hydrogenase maturation protein [Catenovulum sp. SM1970]|uniref:enoyl-CoA hydratase-related protein n=1 Tax=Marinifaba aquimaris TaxID=2741323 RepID=UPI00157262BA|nr:enoyl-CoA hydratase-related protein [Marinifaba aquimaris]NTS75524.1 hydrogenase maturation protein [Marinifaba aquimaris]
MRILLISTSFNGLTQRFFTELNQAGHQVSVELHHGDEQKLVEGVEKYQPDIIFCPFLTRKIPAYLYNKYLCIIVHPGIKGDRGPSSLDWAIMNELPEWGVTLLQADDEMDAGDIWASRTFPMRKATKSSIYNREVSQAAIECLWDVLEAFEVDSFKPEPLDYDNPNIKGQLQPLMKQTVRQINWQEDSSEEIVKRIRAADGMPGVLDEINGREVFLHNAHVEMELTGTPGEIIATCESAICRATTNGAVWIGHLRKQSTDKADKIKRPAKDVVADLLPADLPCYQIDYTKAGKQKPHQEVWFEIKADAAYLHFECHNGAMSTLQCQQILEVYQHLAKTDVKAIVLMGGENFWSNGIHLNVIEASEDPAEESWLNINAINDIVEAILNTTDKLTFSAVAGNAGAGGAILALAADEVYLRHGVILNPHYKGMGGLHGSEYWTYLLPKHVGDKAAVDLTENRLPLNASQALTLGMANKILDDDHNAFYGQVEHLVELHIQSETMFDSAIRAKQTMLKLDTSQKPLQSYRDYELAQMRINFFGEDKSYHQARTRFVQKVSCGKQPLNIALHHREDWVLNKETTS